MSLILTVLGIALVLISAPIGFLTPFIPVGLPLAIAGLVLIGRNSRTGKHAIMRLAKRRPWARTLYLRRLRPVLAR